MNTSKMASAIITAILSAAILAGCGRADDGSTDSSGAPSGSSPASAVAAAAASIDVSFDSSDEYFDWKSGSYTTLDMSAGSQAVTKSGVYEITGTLDDGSLTVDVDKSTDAGTVTLVLNNTSISSAASAPIYVKDAQKVVLILENGTASTLRQGGGITVNSDGEPSAAVFSKADLTITGGGTLNVVSDYNDGITSKDTLKITDGTLVLETAGDGIVGKDILAIENANITVTAGKDGLRSTNDTDAGMGSILIKNGRFNITAANDAIQAYSVLQISGGTLTLTSGDDAIHADGDVTISSGIVTIENSYEGVEGTSITITGGTITVTSDDDGFNVNDNGGLLTFGGGDIYVNAGGDGLDSNGTVIMTGGIVLVDGPTNNGNGAIDYNGSFDISGGTLVATGSSGMAQTPGTGSSQPAILMYYTATQAAGTTVTLRDSSGAVAASFTPSKQYASAAISAPGLEIGGTYTLMSGDIEVVTFTLSDIVTYLNESGVTTAQGMMPGGGFNNGGQFQSGKPDRQGQVGQAQGGQSGDNKAA